MHPPVILVSECQLMLYIVSDCLHLILSFLVYYYLIILVQSNCISIWLYVHYSAHSPVILII